MSLHTQFTNARINFELRKSIFTDEREHHLLTLTFTTFNMLFARIN